MNKIERSIGGLFDSDEVIQQAFEISIEAINKNIAGSKHATSVLLIPKSEKISKNSFQVSQIGMYVQFTN